jgi:hypothetical protein
LTWLKTRCVAIGKVGLAPRTLSRAKPTMKADLPDSIVHDTATSGALQTPSPRPCQTPTSGADAGMRAFDCSAHAALTAVSSGLSPASFCLAWVDWARHLAISPGKCLELWQQALQHADAGRNAAAAATDSHGASFARGARHLLEDIQTLSERSRGLHKRH